jgi:hypothetical protein
MFIFVFAFHMLSAIGITLKELSHHRQVLVVLDLLFTMKTGFASLLVNISHSDG